MQILAVIARDRKSLQFPEKLHIQASILATVSFTVLQKLSSPNGSFVCLKYYDKQHVAQLCLSNAPHLEFEMALAPLLAWQLGLRDKNAIYEISVHFYQPKYLQTCEFEYAESATISPIASSVLGCKDNNSFASKLQDLPLINHQLVQNGDLLAVPLAEKMYDREESRPAYGNIILARGMLNDSETQWTIPTNLTLKKQYYYFQVQNLSVSKDAKPLRLSKTTQLFQTLPLIKSTSVNTRNKSDCFSAQPHITEYVKVSTYHKVWEVVSPCQYSCIAVSIILTGPHGSGKRSLVHAVARELGVRVLEIPFYSSLIFEKDMEMWLEIAKKLGDCVVYVRHWTRSSHEEETRNDLLVRLFARLGEMKLQILKSIPFFACAENSDAVDPTIYSSFLHHFSLPLPCESERSGILQSLVPTGYAEENIQWKELAEKTTGFTPGGLFSLVNLAKSIEIKRLIASNMTFFPCKLSEASILSAMSFVSKESKTSCIPSIQWSDVGGLEDAKQEISDLIQLPLQYPHLFPQSRSGLLLYGPPGTGKTMLAKAIATECDLNFLNVKGPELLNMYIGESERNIREIFQKARDCQPSLLFFDELDSLAPMRNRGSDSGGVMDRVVSQLLTEMDGLARSNTRRVFIIGASNRPDLLDSSLLRPGRLDRLVYLGIHTSRKEKLKIIRALTREFKLAADVSLESVVEKCDDTKLTGADLYSICANAFASALSDRIRGLDTKFAQAHENTMQMFLEGLPEEDVIVYVHQSHFMQAIEGMTPSISTSELTRYERMRENFSDSGSGNETSDAYR